MRRIKHLVLFLVGAVCALVTMIGTEVVAEGQEPQDNVEYHCLDYPGSELVGGNACDLTAVPERTLESCPVDEFEGECLTFIDLRCSEAYGFVDDQCVADAVSIDPVSGEVLAITRCPATEEGVESTLDRDLICRHEPICPADYSFRSSVSICARPIDLGGGDSPCDDNFELEGEQCVRLVGATPKNVVQVIFACIDGQPSQMRVSLDPTAPFWQINEQGATAEVPITSQISIATAFPDAREKVRFIYPDRPSCLEPPTPTPTATATPQPIAPNPTATATATPEPTVTPGPTVTPAPAAPREPVAVTPEPSASQPPDDPPADECGASGSDTDGDGVADSVERLLGFDPCTTNAASSCAGGQSVFNLAQGQACGQSPEDTTEEPGDPCREGEDPRFSPSADWDNDGFANVEELEAKSYCDPTSQPTTGFASVAPSWSWPTLGAVPLAAAAAVAAGTFGASAAAGASSAVASASSGAAFAAAPTQDATKARIDRVELGERRDGQQQIRLTCSLDGPATTEQLHWWVDGERCGAPGAPGTTTAWVIAPGEQMLVQLAAPGDDEIEDDQIWITLPDGGGLQ